jgi:beta-glucanase (GH16 family)
MARTPARGLPLVPLAVYALMMLLPLLCLATATQASAAVPTNGCVTKLRKSTGGFWQCSFADDFTGSSLSSSKWSPQRTDMTGFTDPMHNGCFVNHPKNISVSNGTLKLTARKEIEPFTCESTHGDFRTSYTAGMVSTFGRFAQTYGRFEIRARTWSTRLPGLQTALWLWPRNATRYGDWPASGEIDIAEIFSRYSDRAVPYIHYSEAAPDPNVTRHDCMIADISAFHTYVVEWSPTSIKIIYDGKTCLVNNSWKPKSPLIRPQPFDHPFVVALTQGLGVDFDPEVTPLPATTEVDYVRVWR